ncbi:MAG: hypothetical protein ACKOHK_09220 [Planctomycetia bacterium]
MERRYAQFIAISLAIVLAGQLLQAWLFPKPPRDRQAPPNVEAAAAAATDNSDAGSSGAAGQAGESVRFCAAALYTAVLASF